MPLSDLSTAVLLAFLPLAGTIFALYTKYQKWHQSTYRKLVYPPGPPPICLFSGRSTDIPLSQPWKTYTEWGKTYGDMIHMSIYKKHTIILNSKEDAVELFERRSGIYSDRRQSLTAQLMGWDFHVGLMAYGDEWRHHRRLYQQIFRPNACLEYRQIQTRKVHEMLQSLLTTPSDFRTHCATSSTAIIISVLYGHDLSSETTRYFVDLATEAMGRLSSVLIPGAASLDCLPFLQRLPAWMPGAGAKRNAKGVKALTEQMQDVPMDFVGKSLLDGSAGPSRVSDLLEDCYMQKEFNWIKQVAATSYAEGASTTVSSMTSFFSAMALFPEAQKRAQDEIDAVIGAERLPSYEDRASLSYVEALFREVLRWRPAIPLGIAHMNTEDDIYKGYCIPKGTVLMANIWAVTRDEAVYPEPESFRPERFIDKEGQLNADDMSIVFGFGRRMCPGQHMASDTLWFSIVSILAAFSIRKNQAASGKEPSLEENKSSSHISNLIPLEVSISPRKKAASKLIYEATK